MRGIVTAVAVVTALIWSALIWGGYAVLAFTTDMLMGGVGGLGLSPEISNLAFWIGSLLDRFGTGTVAVIWIVGLAGIWLLRTVINRIVGAATPSTQAEIPSAPQPHAEPNRLPHDQQLWKRDDAR